jgi:hypothetical protein
MQRSSKTGYADRSRAPGPGLAALTPDRQSMRGGGEGELCIPSKVAISDSLTSTFCLI